MHSLMANYYHGATLFTAVYTFVFLFLLSDRIGYSHPARGVAWMLLATLALAVKDSLGVLLLPLFDTTVSLGRFLGVVSPLFVFLPAAFWNMLIHVYNTSCASDQRAFARPHLVTLILAGLGALLMVLTIVHPPLMYSSLAITAHPAPHYRYASGPLLLLFTLMLAASTLPVSIALLRLSIGNHRREPFLIAIGALISLSVAVATTTVPALVTLQELPRLDGLALVVVNAFSLYALLRYGRAVPVARILREQDRSRMIVDSLEKLVEVNEEPHLLQHTCDYARRVSESTLGCILSFDARDSYRVHTVSATLDQTAETLCSLLPLAPGREYQVCDVTGIARQQESRVALDFRSLRSFFGSADDSQSWTTRVCMFDFRQILSFPILSDNRVWGALVLFREGILEQSGLLRIFSVQCSLILRFSAQVKELEKVRQLEEQLHQSRKMEAVGQLAGGVAHDFNNMLSGISGYAQLIKRRFAHQTPELKTYADALLSAARSASDLTEKLLTFARKGKRQSVAVDINQTIGTVIDLLERTIDKRITITRRFDASPAVVAGDPTQLQNMVLNLALNARNAMPEGGELTFETRTVCTAPGTHPPGPGVREGNQVLVSVIDTGTGMSEEVREHIFEPFFTTRSSGAGTGLGLASVYGTVRSHEGHIEVTSAPGNGSRFDVYLPCPNKATGSQKAAGVTQELVRGSGHILVVDDEEMIRRLTEELLSFLGYTVHTCEDGPSALAYFRAHAPEVDLVILDVMMPRMDGFETCRGLRELRNDVKVIIMTGYSVKEDTGLLSGRGIAGFIRKPFEGADVSRLIHEVLTGQGERPRYAAG